MFQVGPLTIPGRVSLAPMAGISDSPYRRVCRRMGAGFSFTEFVSAKALRAREARALEMLRFDPAERPIVFQIFGHDPTTVREAALVAQELGPDAIDLNMGCSCSRVANRGSGAGLLEDLPRAGRILEQMVRALEVPVTAKIRLGPDDRRLNYLETARVLEASGVAMISVHGRTRSQAYKGRARWEPIGEIKALASIPVLGNGDVRSAREAEEQRSRYGLDGVLVGRGAIGNPWLFAGRERAQVSAAEVVAVALEHARAMQTHYSAAAVLFRKHAARYFGPLADADDLRSAAVRIDSIAELESICEEFLAHRAGRAMEAA